MLKKGHLPLATPSTSPRGCRVQGGALLRCVESWLADGEARGWSTRTLDARRDMLGKFAWWLREQGISETFDAVTAAEVRRFLAYLRHPADGSRWGGDAPNAANAARPSTVDTYYRCLRAFFNFALAESLIDESPLRRVGPVRVPKDQIQPFTDEQVQALVDAAKRAGDGPRDQAIVGVLVDTGMRVGELCSLSVGDVDPDTKTLSVLGKGKKRRQLPLSANVRRLLWRYRENERRDASDDEPLFIARRGTGADAGLTPSGIHKLFRRLGKAAGIRDVRCSPHTCRHYFAVSMLRRQASVFAVQQLLGHEDLTMVRRYVALAQADLASAHRMASPAKTLKF